MSDADCRWLHIRTRARPVCGTLRRGGVVQGRQRSTVGLVDLPAFGRPVRLVWRKWRWRCPAASCDVGSFTEVDEQIAPARAALTARAGRWATVAVGRDARPVADVAAELGCDWSHGEPGECSPGARRCSPPTPTVVKGARRRSVLDETLFGRRRWAALRIRDIHKAGGGASGVDDARRSCDVLDGRRSGKAHGGRLLDTAARSERTSRGGRRPRLRQLFRFIHAW